MAEPRPGVLFVGESDHAELREAWRWLDQRAAAVAARDADAAYQLFAAGLMPDVIVLAQSRPGEFPHEVVDRLRRLAPLAAMVGLAGSWCEGEGRSGSPPPGVPRVYWHQWAARAPAAFAELLSGRGPWALPVTAAEEERCLAETEAALPQQRGRVRVGVHAACPETRRFLVEACRAGGYEAVELPLDGSKNQIHGGLHAVIFAGTDAAEREADALARLCAAVDAPVVAILGFPRREDCQRAVDAGATAVLSKPLTLAELYAALGAAGESEDSRGRRGDTEKTAGSR